MYHENLLRVHYFFTQAILSEEWNDVGYEQANKYETTSLLRCNKTVPRGLNDMPGKKTT